MRSSWRLALVLALGVVWLLPQPGMAVPTAPEPSYSHYLSFASASDLCDFGNETAQGQASNSIDDDALVFLHFHAPQVFSNGDYGASMGAAPPKRIGGVTGPNASGIELLLQKYGNCYANSNPAGSTLKLVAGVTNDDPADPQSSVTSGHGSAWGNLIVRMNNWAANQGIGTQVSYNGGFDPEPGFFSSVGPAKSWTNGYRNGNGNWNLVYYGGANGCPSDKNPNGTCTWPHQDIEYMAWTAGETVVFPQIYDEEPSDADPPTSVNAQQWQKLSANVEPIYGRMNFIGGLSQLSQCSPNCGGAGNGPKASWRDLWNELNCTFDPDAFECRTEDDLHWTTDLADNQAVPTP